MSGQQLNRVCFLNQIMALPSTSGQVMGIPSIFFLFGQCLSDKHLFQLRILPTTLQRVVRTTFEVAKTSVFQVVGYCRRLVGYCRRLVGYCRR